MPALTAVAHADQSPCKQPATPSTINKRVGQDVAVVHKTRQVLRVGAVPGFKP